VPAGRYRPDVPEWIEHNLSQALQADPEKRYETAEQWLLQLQQGELKTLNARPRPLLEREPLKVWQTIAVLSLIANLLMWLWLIKT